MFCYNCRVAVELGIAKIEKALDDAFIKTGFSMWKKAIERFRMHQGSYFHVECTDFIKQSQTGIIQSPQLLSKDMTSN